MTNKQLKASSEARLWVGQIIIPTITVIGTFGFWIMTTPELQEAITERKEKIKKSIRNKFKKK